MSTYKIFLEKYAEYGVVEEVNHPVVIVRGLPSVFPNEVVYFENNQKGKVMSLHKDKVEVLLFAQRPIKKGMKVARSGMTLSVEMGDFLLGQVVDPLGKMLTPSGGMIKSEEERPIDVAPRKITERAVITQPLTTGVSVVDLLLPLGKGQREMVTGDRKTGKSSFVLSTIKTQISEGSIVVYAAIGKKAVEIEQHHAFFKKEGLMANMVYVAVSSLEAQSLIYISPFTAMAIAEHFAAKGKNVLVVLDDLSTHGKFYREISLLSKRFPGRDSYPGDIFYTHARLLERAGNYINEQSGESAITCLPLAETLENDLTDYIVSNLISITDGHLLFDSNEFIKGHRPAINPDLSVTRVGKQTRTVLHQDINQQLMGFLAQYRKSLTFSHFGSELTDDIKKVLYRGEMLYAFFQQTVTEIVPIDVQYLMVAIIWLGLFKEKKEVASKRRSMVDKYNQDPGFVQIVKQAVSVVTFDDLIESVEDKKKQLGLE